MENASKALLIAASVLIVILLIAFGMRIFNSTKGTGEQVEGVMQTTEMAMFNNKFLPYIGKNKRKSEVLSLLNIIQVNNATNSRKIEVDLTIGSDNWEGAQNCITNISEQDSSKTWTIFIPEGEIQEGYITKISII